MRPAITRVGDRLPWTIPTLLESMDSPCETGAHMEKNSRPKARRESHVGSRLSHAQIAKNGFSNGNNNISIPVSPSNPAQLFRAFVLPQAALPSEVTAHQRVRIDGRVFSTSLSRKGSRVENASSPLATPATPSYVSPSAPSSTPSSGNGSTVRVRGYRLLNSNKRSTRPRSRPNGISRVDNSTLACFSCHADVLSGE